MEYIIVGDPIPLSRARHGNGKTWDPQKQLKLHWKLMLEDQHKDKPLLTGPLHMEIVFFMAKPQTSMKRKLELDGKPQFYKPDLDNLIKWVCDCSSNVLFKDDALVASLECRKVYDDQPRTYIKIIEMNNGKS